MIIKIRKNAQITIPTKFMKKLGLEAGEYLNCFQSNGIIQLSPLYLQKEQKKMCGTLKINCFGRFGMTIDGETILLKNQKAEELIAYLICEHGGPVSKTQICNVLWPRVYPDNAMNSLYKVCQYIVKNYNYIPLVSERNRLLLNIAAMETDVMDFLTLFKNKDIESDEQAAELYKGALLKEALYDWTTQFESFYEIKFIEILARLTDYHTKHGNKDWVLYYKNKQKELFADV